MARPSPKAYLFLNEDNHIDDTEAIRLEKRGDAIQRGLTIVTIVMRIVDFLSSYAQLYQAVNHRVISLAAAGYTLTEYFVTENTVIEGENLWPPSDDVMLWPTILTLIVAVVTLILTTIVLIAYCNGTAAADRWERRRSTFGNIATCFTIFKMIACAVASSSMYITGQSTAPGPQSLWRIACDASQEAQDLFHRIIDLGNYCTLQAYSIAKVTS